MEQIRNLLSALMFGAWGHRTGKEGLALFLSNSASWWWRVRDVIDQNVLGKPESHHANKNCDSFSHVNSEPLHKGLKHREVKTAVHTCIEHRPSDLT